MMIQILTVAASSAPSWSFLSKLWNSLKALQWAAVISALILTIGAIIEYWKQLKLLVLLIGKWILRRLSPVESCVLKKLLIHTLGPILVVLGIAGDFIFEGRAFILEDRQEDEAQGTIASLKDRAAANEAKAAQLSKDAEGLKKDAEDEHTARVEIEAKVAWRRLTDKEKTDLASKLGEFPPNSEGASFWYVAGDIEAATFAVDIAEAIKLTHTVVQPPGDIMMLHESGKFGSPIKPLELGVSVLSTKDDVSRRFADRLVKELNAKGFDCAIRTDPPYKDSPAPQIEVFIHPRPQGPQGELKLQAEREAKTKKTAKSK